MDVTLSMTASWSTPPQRGDRDAFRTLFERYHRRAYALAFGVVRHQDDALDVVQDAFIKAHKYLDKFEGNSSFYTWLYRIVMNLAIDHLRKHRRVKPGRARRGASSRTRPMTALLPRMLGGNPGRALMDKEIRARIDQALDELSENHRAVLVMRELEGLSYEEMAQAMGCSKGTIMSRLFHARKNMQKRLLDLVDRRRRPRARASRRRARRRRAACAGARPSDEHAATTISS